MDCLIKTVTFLIFSCVAITANSAEISEGQWTSLATVTSVQIHENTTFRIKTETEDNTSAVCVSENGVYWWPSSDLLAKEAYSTALAAFATERKVSVVYQNECNIGAKRLTHIVISK